MNKTALHLLATVALVTAAAPVPAFADSPPNFGDDASRFSKDGECDDMRFEGAGMSDTLLIDSDIFHDATDCRAAFNQGRLRYLGGHRHGTPSNSGNTTSHIQWGDDSSKYSKDGECDDKRFAGAGMTTTPLLDSDIQHDATDCRAAYNAGRLTLRP